MSSTTASIIQSQTGVNTHETLYYPTYIKPAVLAAQKRLTPEQVEANNRLAAALRAENAVLLAGPVKDGAMIRVPSWRWNPELVQVIKSSPGARFEKERSYTLDITLHHHTYTPTITMATWTVPDAPGRFERIRAVYDLVFAREIAIAKSSQRYEALGRI
jgi:hypothetical protein